MDTLETPPRVGFVPRPRGGTGGTGGTGGRRHGSVDAGAAASSAGEADADVDALNLDDTLNSTITDGRSVDGSLAEEDVLLLSEHIATVKLEAEEKAFRLNQQLRAMRKENAELVKENRTLNQKLFLASPSVPRGVTNGGGTVSSVPYGKGDEYGDEEELLDGEGKVPERSEMDPVEEAWNMGNAHINEGNVTDGVRFYTNAARMLSANLDAAKARVSNLESELEESNAERVLFANRDADSRAKCEELTKQFDDLRRARDIAESESSQMEALHRESLDQVQVVSEQLQAAVAAAAEREAEYIATSKATAEEMEFVQEELHKTRSQLEEAEAENKRLGEQLEVREAESAQRASEQVASLSEQLQAAQVARESSDTALQSLRRDFAELEKTEREYFEQIGTLEEQLSDSIGKQEHSVLLEQLERADKERTQLVAAASTAEAELSSQLAESTAKLAAGQEAMTKQKGLLIKMTKKCQQLRGNLEEEKDKFATAMQEFDAERFGLTAQVVQLQEHAALSEQSAQAAEQGRAWFEQQAQQAEERAQQALQALSQTPPEDVSDSLAASERLVAELRAKLNESRAACMEAEVERDQATSLVEDQKSLIVESSNNQAQQEATETALYERIQGLEAQISSLTSDSLKMDELQVQVSTLIAEKADLETQLSNQQQQQQPSSHFQESFQVQPQSLDTQEQEQSVTASSFFDANTPDLQQNITPQQSEGVSGWDQLDTASPVEGNSGTGFDSSTSSWFGPDSNSSPPAPQGLPLQSPGSAVDMFAGNSPPPPPTDMFGAMQQEQSANQATFSEQEGLLQVEIAQLRAALEDANARLSDTSGEIESLKLELETASQRAFTFEQSAQKACDEQADLHNKLAEFEYLAESNRDLQAELAALRESHTALEHQLQNNIAELDESRQRARDRGDLSPSPTKAGTAPATVHKELRQANESTPHKQSPFAPNDGFLSEDQKFSPSPPASLNWDALESRPAQGVPNPAVAQSLQQSPGSVAFIEPAAPAADFFCDGPSNGVPAADWFAASSDPIASDAEPPQGSDQEKAQSFFEERATTSSPASSFINQDSATSAEAAFETPAELPQDNAHAKPCTSVQNDNEQAALRSALAEAQAQASALEARVAAAETRSAELESAAQQQLADSLANSGSTAIDTVTLVAAESHATKQTELALAAEQRAASAESECASLQSQLQVARSEVNSLRESSSLAEQQLDEQVDRCAELNADLAAAKEALSFAEAAKAKAESSVTSLQAEMDSLKVAHADSEARFATELAEMDGAKQSADLNQLRDQVASRQTALEKAEKDLQQTLDRAKEFEQAAVETGAIVDALRADLESQHAELAAVKETEAGLVAELESANELAKTAQENLENANKTLFDLEVNKASLETRIVQFEGEREEAERSSNERERAHENALAEQIAKDNAMLEKLRGEVAKGEEEIADLREQQRAVEVELARQTEMMVDRKSELEFEMRSLSDHVVAARQRETELEADLCEVHEQKAGLEAQIADLKERFKDTSELDAVKDELLERKRALDSLGKRVTKLIGVNQQLQLERDRAREDAAALYSAGADISAEIEQRGSGLRRRSRSPGASGRIAGISGIMSSNKTGANDNQANAKQGDDESLFENAPEEESDSLGEGSEEAETEKLTEEFFSTFEKLDKQVSEFVAKEKVPFDFQGALQKALESASECEVLADTALLVNEQGHKGGQQLVARLEKLEAALSDERRLVKKLGEERARGEDLADERCKELSYRVRELEKELIVAQEQSQDQDGQETGNSALDLLSEKSVEIDQLKKDLASTSEHCDSLATELEEARVRCEKTISDLARANELLDQAQAQVTEQQEMTKKQNGEENEIDGSPALLSLTSLPPATALSHSAIGASPLDQEQLRVALEDVGTCIDMTESILQGGKPGDFHVPASGNLDHCATSASASESVLYQEVCRERDDLIREKKETIKRVTFLEKQLAMRKSIFGNKLAGSASNDSALAAASLAASGDTTSSYNPGSSVSSTPSFPPPSAKSGFSSPGRSRVASPISASSSSRAGFADIPRIGGPTSIAGIQSTPVSSTDQHEQGDDVIGSSLVTPWSDKFYAGEINDVDFDEGEEPEEEAFNKPSPQQNRFLGADAPAPLTVPGQLNSPPSSGSAMRSPPAPGEKWNVADSDAATEDYNRSPISSVGGGAIGVFSPGGASSATPGSTTGGNSNETEPPISPMGWGAPPQQQSGQFDQQPPLQGQSSQHGPPGSGPPQTQNSFPAGNGNSNPPSATSLAGNPGNSDKKQKTKGKDTSPPKPRFLSRMFGIGKHRDLVEANIGDENSDFEDEDETNTMQESEPGTHPESNWASNTPMRRASDMADPFKAAREIRSRTHSNMSQKTLEESKPHLAHEKAYPAYELENKPSGIVSGSASPSPAGVPGAPASDNNAPPIPAPLTGVPANEISSAFPTQQPPYASGGSFEPLQQPGALQPVHGFETQQGFESQQQPFADSSDTFGGNEASLETPNSIENVPPSSPFTSPQGGQFQWSNEAADNIAQAPPSLNLDGSETLFGDQKEEPPLFEGTEAAHPERSPEDWKRLAGQWERERLELAEKIKDLEEQLDMEREHRIWRERQFCCGERDLQQALEENQEFKSHIDSLQYSLDEARANLESVHVDNSRLQETISSTNAEAQRANDEVRRLMQELDSKMAQMANVTNDGQTLRADLARARADTGANHQRLKHLEERLAARDKDYNCLIEELGLAMYAAATHDSPSAQIADSEASVTQQRRRSAGKGFIPKPRRGKILRFIGWAYSIFFPHLLLFLTAFLLSVGTGPEVIAELTGTPRLAVQAFPS